MSLFLTLNNNDNTLSVCEKFYENIVEEHKSIKYGDLLYEFLYLMEKLEEENIITIGDYEITVNKEIDSFTCDDISNLTKQMVFPQLYKENLDELSDFYMAAASSVRFMATRKEIISFLEKRNDDKLDQENVIDLKGIFQDPHIFFEKTNKEDSDSEAHMLDYPYARRRHFECFFSLNENEELVPTYIVDDYKALISLDFMLYFSSPSRRGTIGICQACGKVFKRTRTDAKYCSQKCALDGAKNNNNNSALRRKYRYLRKLSVEKWLNYTREDEKFEEICNALRKEWRGYANELLEEYDDDVMPGIDVSAFEKLLKEKFNKLLTKYRKDFPDEFGDVEYLKI